MSRLLEFLATLRLFWFWLAEFFNTGYLDKKYYFTFDAKPIYKMYMYIIATFSDMDIMRLIYFMTDRFYD
jgi:hypothetical protein